MYHGATYIFTKQCDGITYICHKYWLKLGHGWKFYPIANSVIICDKVSISQKWTLSAHGQIAMNAKATIGNDTDGLMQKRRNPIANAL